ncbi:hypothetical protein HK102_007298 [Quaeritorhiza haematococci]|nr:hypothetical protein HK102_007298 [Quaeritorhiza haematococci]
MRGEADGYVENFLCFYRLRSEGAFQGHEHQWVLIEDGRVTKFFNNEDEADEYPAKRQAVLQPVNDDDFQVDKKRKSSYTTFASKLEYKVPLKVRYTGDDGSVSSIQLDDVCFGTGCGRTTLQFHHIAALGRPPVSHGPFGGLGNGSGTVFRAKISGLNVAGLGWTGRMRLDFWDEDSTDECLLGFDVLQFYALASIPTTPPRLVLAATTEDLQCTLHEERISRVNQN